MGKKFSEEVQYIPEAIAWAFKQEVKLLARALGGLSGKSLLAIGSGGSSTAAAFLAQTHEISFRQIARSATPGEFLSRQASFENSGAVLISAEGKNLDILAAAKRVATLEIPSIALVLNDPSPLGHLCRDNSSITVVPFPMPWVKDGYLATNSLIAMMVLIARAYQIEGIECINSIDCNWLSERRSLLTSQGLAEHMACHSSLAVLYGTVGKIGAIDIESKLSEAAFGTCELTDYRQFAHGRHLQLGTPGNTPCFLAFHCSQDVHLSEATLALFPPNIPVIKLELPDDPTAASIMSVIDAMLVTDILGAARNRDPGQPVVSTAGRAMHNLNVQEHLTVPTSLPAPMWRKFSNENASNANVSIWREAALAFSERIANARIKALVCDFDGTFCNTDLRFDGLDERLIPVLEGLIRNGIMIGFATGRGDSLYRDLREKLSPDTWPNILIGYYSGSLIEPLANNLFNEPVTDPRFQALEQWLTSSVLTTREDVSLNKRAGQFSIRLGLGSNKNRISAAIRHWLHKESLHEWRVFCSGHSIDVLNENAGKERVINAIASRIGCDPIAEILRIGDSGDFDGNDFELLNDGLGLSVDCVSPCQPGCWNLLPIGLRGVVGTLYYLQALELVESAFQFSPKIIAEIRNTLEVRETLA